MVVFQVAQELPKNENMFKHFSCVIPLRLHYIQDKYQVFLAQQFAHIIQVEKH